MFDFLKSKKRDELDQESLQKACEYIQDYWRQITRIHGANSDTLFGLPNPYIVPANQHDNFSFNEQYYWDSYFIALGLISNGKNQMAEGMLENLFYMFKHFNMIPNASRLYMTGRSQPPFLTSYILLIFKANEKSKEWLKKAMRLAEAEYLTVWMGTMHPHYRQIYHGLSRYYDVNALHDLAEAESGWDMTTRFGRKALDFLPIDLNSLLYRYEKDFARFYEMLDDEEAARIWLGKAAVRRKKINELMWNKRSKFFFDYNYNKKSQGHVWSLAAYYTMWAGLATKKQAKHLVKNLHRFEHKGGLSTTAHNLIDVNLFGSIKTQWAYPNGWAPLHLIIIEGLERYGYKEEAEKIAKKWLATNLNWFKINGEFLEKYNVVEPNQEPIGGVYPTQVGFAWTNAVFLYLAQKYGLLDVSKKEV
jgi:alpha,alpha-trehalase